MKNKYLVFLIVVLLLASPVMAKNFIVRNASDANQSYFMINGTDGDVEIPGNLNLGNGSIWYNDSDNKYYYYNETSWIEIGSGSATASNITTLMGLHNPDYDSGWIEVTSSEMILDHGLDTESTLDVLERNETSFELRNLSGMVLLMRFNGTDGYNEDGVSDATGRHVFYFQGDTHINTSVSKFGGSAVKFDGYGDTINFSDSADWDFGSGEFTIETWANLIDWSGNQYQTFVSYLQSGTNGDRSFEVSSIGGGEEQIRFYADGCNSLQGNISTWGDNTWHHIAVTRVGNVFTLYLDGVAANSMTCSNSLSSVNSDMLQLGTQTNLADRSINGSMDELALYKGRALSAEEVMNHFNRKQHIYLAEKNSSSIKLVSDDFIEQARVKMWKEGAIEGNYSGNLIASGNFSLGDKITFSLGAVIDNIVSGWTRVTSNLNVTGNFSLGGKLLWNNNGTLTWGSTNIESTNVSVLYGTNSSGATKPLQTTDSGVLKLSVSSLKSDVWDATGDVVNLNSGTDVNISGDLNVTGSARIGGDLNVVGNVTIAGNLAGVLSLRDTARDLVIYHDLTMVNLTNMSFTEAILQDSNGVGIRVGATDVTINMSDSGVNGLDTGASSTNTWYYIWAISDGAGNTNGLYSASAISPTMPTGYNYKARLGAVFRNGTNVIEELSQVGNKATTKKIQYTNWRTDSTYYGVNMSSNAGYEGTAGVPPIAKSVFVTLQHENSAVASNVGYIASTSTGLFEIYDDFDYGSANVNSFVHVEVPLVEKSVVYFKILTGSARRYNVFSRGYTL